MTSLLPEFMTDPKCGLDIYETESADVWARCNTGSAKFGAIVGVIIVFIIMLIAFFSTDSTLWRVIYVLGAISLSIGILFGAYYLAGDMARVEYARYENELESYMRNGMSRPEAVKEIKREREKLRAAQMQADATRSQGFMIANALRRR